MTKKDILKRIYEVHSENKSKIGKMTISVFLSMFKFYLRVIQKKSKFIPM